MKRFCLFVSVLIGQTFVSYAQSGLDNTFGMQGILKLDTGSCQSMSIQPDGKIVAVGGLAVSGKGAVVIRFNPSGSLDHSFSDNGYFWGCYTCGVPKTVALQADGKIILGGSKSITGHSDDFWLLRLKPSGAIDSSFGLNGIVTTPFISQFGGHYTDVIRSLAIQADGKIIASGDVNENIGVARYLPNGNLDSTFGTNGQTYTITGNFGGPVNNVSLLPSGKIIVGADASNGGSVVCVAVRYTPDGKSDTSFAHTGKVFTPVGGLAYCKATTVQPDGKILQAGFNDSAFLIRINQDGSPDLSFGRGGVARFAPASIRTMLLRMDGKILLGGDRGQDGIVLYRCNADGSTDQSFGLNGSVTTIAGSADNSGECLLLQPDGKVLLGGESESRPAPNDYPQFTLLRYLPNAPQDIDRSKEVENNLHIYPIPAQDKLFIKNESNIPIYAVEILDIEGRLVALPQLSVQNGISLKSLSAGSYLLHITFKNNYSLYKKLLIKN